MTNDRFLRADIQKRKNILVTNLPEGGEKTRPEGKEKKTQKDSCCKAKEKLAMNIEGHYLKSNTSPEASQGYSKNHE